MSKDTKLKKYRITLRKPDPYYTLTAYNTSKASVRKWAKEITGDIVVAVEKV